MLYYYYKWKGDYSLGMAWGKGVGFFKSQNVVYLVCIYDNIKHIDQVLYNNNISNMIRQSSSDFKSHIARVAKKLYQIIVLLVYLILYYSISKVILYII